MGSSRYPDQVGAQVCRLLPIAPSTYHAHMAARRDPACASDRVRRDAELRPEIARVHAENFGLSRRAQGLAPARPRGRRGRPLHRGAADARHGAARGGARQDREDDGPGPGCTVPAGPREAAVPRARAGSAVGQRLHLRRHLAGLRLRRLRHRRLRAEDRGLARQPQRDGELRARRAGASHPPAPARQGYRADRALGPRVAVSCHSVHRAPGRGRHRALGGLDGGRLRQCPRGDGHRPLQDRGHPPPRPVAQPRGGRVRHPRTEGPRAAANGWIGSTTAGSSARSVTSRPPRQKPPTTRRWTP